MSEAGYSSNRTSIPQSVHYSASVKISYNIMIILYDPLALQFGKTNIVGWEMFSPLRAATFSSQVQVNPALS